MKQIFTTLLLCMLVTLSAQEYENKKTMKGPMLGLRTAAYKVTDLEAAKQWYTDAFQTKPYFDEPYYAGFNIKGYELALMPEEEPPSEKSDNILVYWGVDDIQKEYDRLIELGATEHEKPTNYGGELMVASVRDPWGNVLGIIYNPYFKL